MIEDVLYSIIIKSLSARRAWIEIRICKQIENALRVALRKESVDRNRGPGRSVYGPVVALRKESVDRNPQPHIFLCNLLGRSPQGERG